MYDTVYTRVRNKGLMTEVFRKNLHEGTFHNTSVIRFDRKGEKAWLSDTVFTDMKTRKVKRSADTAVAIQGMEHSIMSAFYYVRTMPLTVGDTSRFSAVSGKKRYELKVLVHGHAKRSRRIWARSRPSRWNPCSTVTVFLCPRAASSSGLPMTIAGFRCSWSAKLRLEA